MTTITRNEEIQLASTFTGRERIHARNEFLNGKLEAARFTQSHGSRRSSHIGTLPLFDEDPFRDAFCAGFHSEYARLTGERNRREEYFIGLLEDRISCHGERNELALRLLLGKTVLLVP